MVVRQPSTDQSFFHQQALLDRLGIEAAVLRHASARCKLLGSSLEAELISLGYLTEDRLYRAMADYAGLPFRETLSAAEILDRPDLDILLANPVSLHFHPEDTGSHTAIAPPLDRLPLIMDWVGESEAVRQRLVVTTPSAIRSAVWEAGEERRIRDATGQLWENQSLLSSRQTLTGRQGYWIGILAGMTLMSAFQSNGILLSLIHLACALIYLGTVLLRLASMPSAKRLKRPRNIDMLASPLPVYTIMVALYREAPVLRQLTQSLGRIDWPTSRLDIKLVCEADDHETLASIAALDLPGHYEVVRVPQKGPRTKPKALSYALPGARGAYVTIYDAEDRPHPLQLREAHARFERNDPSLVCLQAPLIVTNGGETWLTTLFALEYAALFRCLMPMLSRHNLPMPLGGTSNHFRRDLLVEAGGWDPFNVTEDADLGTRLKRMGYRMEMLSCPTLEEAPASRKVWMGQRSRWFKGWLQTCLVSFRQPVLLFRQLRPLGFLVYLLTTVGLLASALIHPFIILLLGNALWQYAHDTLPQLRSVDGILMIVDGFNLMGGYACFLLAGVIVMEPHERKVPWSHYWAIPAYWFLLSYAAWRAVLEIRHSPHFWNKTPHSPVNRQAKAERKKR